MMFSSTLLMLSAIAPAVFAVPFITAPVDSTTWTAGSEQVIQWGDMNGAPSLKDFGPSMVSLYVGGKTQQTQLQLIADNVDLESASAIKFTPDPSKGEDGKFYFIRIESKTLKDTAQPQFPALAFSAKFTIKGMKGTFTPAIKAQINDGTGPAITDKPNTPNTPANNTKPATTKPANETKPGTQPDGAVSVVPGLTAGFATVALALLAGTIF